MKETQHIKPARVFPPGRTIKNELEARGWKQREFAQVIGRPVQYVSDLVRGKRMLTVSAARELEAALGPSAEFWLGLETHYRLWLEDQKGDSEKLADIRRRVGSRGKALAS